MFEWRRVTESDESLWTPIFNHARATLMVQLESRNEKKRPNGAHLSQACLERTKKIDAAEYFALALSNRQLERSDESNDDILGLYDPATGNRFIIERAHLLAATLGARRKV